MGSQLERVDGPYRGYFVAAYATPALEHPQESLAYYKVYAMRPESYFDEAVTLHKASVAPRPGGAGAALEAALREAFEVIGTLPDAIDLPAYRQARGLFFWEAAELGLV